MSAARIDAAGIVKVLDGKAASDEVVTVEDVQDPAKLAKLLTRIVANQAAARRAFVAKRIDFEDVVVSTLGAAVSLQHNLSGRVRWWVCGWQSAASTAPYLREDTTKTTTSTLVLLSYVAGTVTIRVEAIG